MEYSSKGQILVRILRIVHSKISNKETTMADSYHKQPS